jgi:uncharacterized protein YyaL (SSP411 family)
MRHITALLLLIFAATTSAVWAQEDETVEWLGDYKQALAEAKRTGKPIFLEYRCEP